ncbi:unnamed protein product [Orchesella dallaii]|uniref:Uncharacterized protein n=1 Tax=Orchesella dallaii TaxID=48710 RepID=A0ABP1R537_9HEXA
MARSILTFRQVITTLAGIYLILAANQWLTFDRDPIVVTNVKEHDMNTQAAAETGSRVQAQIQQEIGHDIIKAEPAGPANGLNPVGTSFKTNGTRYGKPSFPPGYEKSGLAQEQHVEDEMSVSLAFLATIFGILLSVMLVAVLFLCLEESFKAQNHLLLLPETVVPCCRNM